MGDGAPGVVASGVAAATATAGSGIAAAGVPGGVGGSARFELPLDEAVIATVRLLERLTHNSPPALTLSPATTAEGNGTLGGGSGGVTSSTSSTTSVGGDGNDEGNDEENEVAPDARPLLAAAMRATKKQCLALVKSVLASLLVHTSTLDPTALLDTSPPPTTTATTAAASAASSAAASASSVSAPAAASAATPGVGGRLSAELDPLPRRQAWARADGLLRLLLRALVNKGITRFLF